MVADGALHQRGQLAAAQRRQGAGPAARATASRTSPAGADAVCFFQWRASRAGAEKFHSALLPHAGTDSRVWREVVELGAVLGAIAEVAGSRCAADVAVVVDWDARWACRAGQPPDVATSSTSTATCALYRALWDAGVAVDMVGPEADLDRLPAGPRADAVPHRPTPLPPTSRAYVEAAGPSWSPTGAASSTRTTTSGSAAIPAPSATCSACAPRSSPRCARASRCGSPAAFSTAPRPTCGPSSCTSRRRGRLDATPTARCPAYPR